MMKALATPVVLALALGGCMSTSGDEATVMDSLIGKELVTDGGSYLSVNADGTMGGQIGGEPVVGTYKANAKQACSVFTAPAQLVGRKFCSVPEFRDDGTVVFNRTDGSTSPVYTIR